MDLYEQMRNDFTFSLESIFPDMPPEIRNAIIGALDYTCQKYDISKKETALAVVEDVVPEAAKIYIAVKKTEGLSDMTIYNYAHVLRNFFECVRKPLDCITPNDIRMYLYHYQQNRNISDRSLDKYRETLCWFFSWAYREEYITKDPSKPIKAIKYTAKERQSLSQLELEHLRLGCKSIRDRAMLEFFYSTGCRVSELTTVKLSDIDMREGIVTLFGKGKKYRKSFINAKAEVAITEYLKSRNDDSEYLFVSERRPYRQLKKGAVEKVIRQIAGRSSVSKNVTPHIIRHTTATQAVNNGMPIEGVSRLLGHANLATTMIYAKVSDESVHAQHVRHIV